MKKILLSLLLLACSMQAFAQVSNATVNILASAAQTATTVNTPVQLNGARKCVHVVVNVTSFTSGTYTPTVQGYDAVANVYYTLLTGAAIAGTGTTVLKVCPSITPAANVAVSDMLPPAWRVTLAGASTPSMTFSVDALLVY